MTDINREAVERLHRHWQGSKVTVYMGGRTAAIPAHVVADMAATLLALRDALDKAEAEIERLRELFRLDGGDHAKRVREMEKAHDRRISKYAEAKDKAERERDEAEQAARVEASARRRFMQERDEALEALREIAGPNPEWSCSWCGGTSVARAILAKHGGEQ